MANPLDRFGREIDRARSRPPFRRDPGFIERQRWWLDAIAGYFRPTFEGEEHVPRDGPMLLVSNHSGGLYTPEAYVLMSWWIRERGAEAPLYVLAHDFLFALPWFGKALRRGGGIPANPDNAVAALDRGSVLVFPGGDHEAFRPWWHRGRIDFGRRRGFARLALRTGVPVVPVVAHGSHDTTIVLSRGDRLANLMRLGRLRSNIMPIVLGLPWGVAPGFLPIVPLPARISMRFLPPRRYEGAPGDPADVERVFRDVTSTMQVALTDMVRRRPRPWID